ncbi:A24 family peptidase [Ferrimonas sp.]|uniref:A24 family peptidase n=1 Tax=Ferrimonas sp. TaxID=2080861 RepID=UPI003A8E4D1E
MLLIILALVSLVVIYSDIRHRKISNITVVFTGVLTAIIALTGPGERIQLLLPIIIVAVGMALMMLNILGAGDTKLLAAYSLGINPELFPGVLLVITLVGATIAIAMLITNRAKARERGVPYGPAITIGGCLGVVLSNLGQ